jgi:hypothetical protein
MSDDFIWGPNKRHPLSQMRTELVWEGKYDEFGRRREVDIAALTMPMQRIETVDEPRQRAAAAGQLELFEKKRAHYGPASGQIRFSDLILPENYGVLVEGQIQGMEIPKVADPDFMDSH